MSAGGEIGELAEATSGPLAMHLLGILRAHEGRYDEAEEAFLGAVEADPEMGSGGVRVYLGMQPLGDIAGAREQGSHGHTRQGGEGKSDVIAPLVTAMSYLAEGRDEEAARMLERALEGKPAGPPPLVALLALSYLLWGEGVEADEAGIRRAAAAAGGRVRRC